MESSTLRIASSTMKMVVSLTPYWSIAGRVLLSMTMILIMLLAIFGNSLVIVVIIKNRGMRTRTNMFLFNLAVTDLLCTLLDMPFSLVTVIRGEWIFGGLVGEPIGNSTQSVSNVCYFNGFATYFFWVTSIHTLMYIAVFKYATIRNPFSASLNERTISVLIAASWLWAAVIGYFSIHGLTTVYFQHYSTQCGPLYQYHDKWTYVHFWIVMCTCYIIPLFIITICYILMFREILAHGQRMSHISDVGTDEIYIRQKRIAVTLVLMLVAFIACWTPWLVFNIYDILQLEQGQSSNITPYINPITFWFGYANSACNPIIYTLRSDAFREGFKQTLFRNVTITGYDVPTHDVKRGIHRHDTLHPLHAETSFNEKDVANIYKGRDYESSLRRTSTNSTYAYSDSPSYLQDSFRSNATSSPSALSSQGEEKRALHSGPDRHRAAFNFSAVPVITESDETEEVSEFHVTAVRHKKKKKRPRKPVHFDDDPSGAAAIVGEPFMLQASVPAILRPHGALNNREPPRVLSKIEDADEDKVSPHATGRTWHTHQDEHTHSPHPPHDPRIGGVTKRNGVRSAMVRYPSVEVLDHHSVVSAMHGHELHVAKGEHVEIF